MTEIFYLTLNILFLV